MIMKMILQTASVTYQSIETQLGNHNNSTRMTLLLVSLIISQFRQASVLVHNFGRPLSTYAQAYGEQWEELAGK